MKKKIFRLALIIVCAVMISVIQLNAQVQQAINFTAEDIEGNEIKLTDFNDKVVILDFWATWCGPCRREIPNLKDIKKTFKDEDFEIISIALERGDDETAVQFVKDNKMDWVHIIDKQKGRELSEKYKIMYIPTMYVLKKGKIVATGLRGEELKKKIKNLLAQ